MMVGVAFWMVFTFTNTFIEKHDTNLKPPDERTSLLFEDDLGWQHW
jgi:hypothetical protein